MRTTENRLLSYYEFDDSVVAAVADVAERQEAMSWQDFLADCGVDQPERVVYEDLSTEFLEFRPQGDFDITKARVFHAPMANSLDANVAYQAATIFAADPTSRLFAVANPSAPGRNAGLLSRKKRSIVASGDLYPAVEPTLMLMEGEGVQDVTHIGGSYGAEKAMVAAEHANNFGHIASRVIAIEPPSVKKRGLMELGAAFKATDKHLMGYVNASNSKAFLEAREMSVGAPGFGAGLMRLTNIAIAKALARGSFEYRSAIAFGSNPEMQAAISWGTESELAIHRLMNDITSRLQSHFGSNRVSTMPLPGQFHALGNDIHLQAALALQGSKS